jgi:Fe2+ or Zn2+ uptake regulation protein
MQEKKDLEEALVRVLSKSGENGATFSEIYASMKSLYPNIRKIEVREVLSILVRNGVIERVPDYERKRMVFRIKAKHREGS